jgi:hypothetical protein
MSIQYVTSAQKCCSPKTHKQYSVNQITTKNNLGNMSFNRRTMSRVHKNVNTRHHKLWKLKLALQPHETDNAMLVATKLHVTE